jgi:hypothetical protein
LDALLTRKGEGKEAKLAFSLNVLMENRHGLCIDVSVALATGTAEREEALRMVRQQRANGFHPKTLGADQAYDTAAFVETVRAEGIAPHVAEHITARRGSNLDGTHDPTSRLRAEPAGPEADRRDLRLGQDDRRLAEESVPRPTTQRSLSLPRCGGLQPGPDREAHARDGVRTR